MAHPKRSDLNSGLLQGFGAGHSLTGYDGYVSRHITWLWAESESGPWVAVYIRPEDAPFNDPTYETRFDVGEPVHVVRDFVRVGDEEREAKIWYVVSLDDGNGGPRAMLGSTRNKAEMRVEIAVLRKLEPLVRLAAEGSDGPISV